MSWDVVYWVAHAIAAASFAAATPIALVRFLDAGRPASALAWSATLAACALWAGFAAASIAGAPSPPPSGVFDALRHGVTLAALAALAGVGRGPMRWAATALAFGAAALTLALDLSWTLGDPAQSLRASARVAAASGALAYASVLIWAPDRRAGPPLAALALAGLAAFDLAIGVEAAFTGGYDQLATRLRGLIALLAAGACLVAFFPAGGVERVFPPSDARSSGSEGGGVRDARRALSVQAPMSAIGVALLIVVAWMAWRAPEPLGALGLLAFALAIWIGAAAAARSNHAGLDPDLAAELAALERRPERSPPSRYDYRAIWTQFVDTVAVDDARRGDGLAGRLIRAVAGALDAPGGAIWRERRDGGFVLLASEGFHHLERAAPPDLAFSTAALAHGDAVDLAREQPFPRPSWIPEAPRGWLMLPLPRRGALEGVLVLQAPPEARALDDEDRALLSALGKQAASYLAEDALAGALAEAREFASFNRRFAFVMHDLKNIAGQLSLSAANAKRRRGDLSHHDAMIDSVEIAAKKVEAMVDELKSGAAPRVARLELGTTLANAIGRRVGQKPRLEPNAEPIQVEVDGARFEAIINNLIDNAYQASDGRAHVVVRALARKPWAIVEIGDNGPGMDQGFVAEKLFAPFQSGKKGGMGLGVYEARDFAENAGGRLEALSAVGRGTVMRLHLPLAAAIENGRIHHHRVVEPMSALRATASEGAGR